MTFDTLAVSLTGNVMFVLAALGLIIALIIVMKRAEVLSVVAIMTFVTFIIAAIGASLSSSAQLMWNYGSAGYVSPANVETMHVVATVLYIVAILVLIATAIVATVRPRL